MPVSSSTGVNGRIAEDIADQITVQLALFFEKHPIG